MNLKVSLFGMAFCALATSPAFALDYQLNNAHVKLVEGTYVPTSINFQLDIAAGTCAAGTMLYYYATGSTDTLKAANAAAVMSILLSAKLTGTTIAFGGNNSGCTVVYVESY